MGDNSIRILHCMHTYVLTSNVFPHKNRVEGFNFPDEMVTYSLIRLTLVINPIKDNNVLCI